MINTFQIIIFSLVLLLLLAWFWFSAYRERFLIKDIFLDILFLFKNFLHWNISKILIWIFAWLLGILLSIPFWLLFWISIYFLDINLLDWFNAIDFLSKYNYSLLIPGLIFILAIFALLFWFSYYKVLLVNLNLKYFGWEMLPFMKNIYFDFAKVYKYFWIVLWMWVYLLIPISIFIVLFLIILFSFWWFSILDPNWLVNSAFSVLSFILVVIFWLVVIYLAYRMYFSYTIFCDEEENNSSKYYVKKSIDLTKWYNNLIKFLVINLFFWLILSPFVIIWQNLENTQNEVSKYSDYRINNNTGALSYQQYQILDLKYWKYSDLDIYEIQRKNNNYNVIYYIFSFLFMYWIIEMVKVSFYKRELLKIDESIITRSLSWFKKIIWKIFKRKEKIEEEI